MAICDDRSISSGWEVNRRRVFIVKENLLGMLSAMNAKQELQLYGERSTSVQLVLKFDHVMAYGEILLSM